MGRIVQPDASARRLTLTLDGETVMALEGESLAGLMVARNMRVFRRTAKGESRAPYCGMGTCFDCRVEVTRPGELPLVLRACMTAVEEGMQVRTGQTAGADR